MKTINVDTSKLEAAANQMTKLAQQWAARNTTAPITVGGGSVVNELEELTGVYQDLNECMVTLAQNTAAFLKNVKTSFEESDRKAASKLRQ